MARQLVNVAAHVVASRFAVDKARVVYRSPKVIMLTGCLRTSVYRMLVRNGCRDEPRFPRPFVLAELTLGRLAHEVHARVEARAATRR